MYLPTKSCGRWQSTHVATVWWLAFCQRVVLRLHDVAVDAGRRVGAEVRQPFGVEEREDADPREHADQHREHEPARPARPCGPARASRRGLLRLGQPQSPIHKTTNSFCGLLYKVALSAVYRTAQPSARSPRLFDSKWRARQDSNL